MFDREAHERAVAYAAVDAGYLKHSDLIKFYNVDTDGTITNKGNVNDTFRTNVMLHAFKKTGERRVAVE